MNRLRFVLRMAWREGRGEGARRLWLLSAAIIAGVAALVAINSFTENMRRAVTEQARALVGADIVFRSNRPFSDSIVALFDSLAPRSERSRVTNLIAMGYVPRTRDVRLIQLRAVEPGYPYYGEITTDPPGVWRSFPATGGALVDPVLLPSLGARVGDTLAIGEGRFPIVGQILEVPGEPAIASAFGARVFIPASSLAGTGLVRFGSRAEYEEYVRLAPSEDAEAIAKKYRPALREQRVGIRTVERSQENLSQALTQLGNFLGLVALVALLLGGLGVASAVNVLIRRKLDTIAVLRCLGAPSQQLLGIYLTLALTMALLGSAVGAGIGIALQQLLPLLFRGLLPVDVRVTPSPGSILLGAGLGLWVAGAFAAAAAPRHQAGVSAAHPPARRGPPAGKKPFRPAGPAPHRGERGRALGDSGRPPAAGRGVRGRDRDCAAGPLARGKGTDRGGATMVPPPLALSLAPGAREPVPPRESDGHGGPRSSVSGPAFSPPSSWCRPTCSRSSGRGSG